MIFIYDEVGVMLKLKRIVVGCWLLEERREEKREDIACGGNIFHERESCLSTP